MVHLTHNITQHKTYARQLFPFSGLTKSGFMFLGIFSIYTQMYTQIFNLNKCETRHFTTHAHKDAYNVYAYSTKFQVEKLLVKHLIVRTIHSTAIYYIHIVYYTIFWVLKCMPIKVCEHAQEWTRNWKYETCHIKRERETLENHFTKAVGVIWDICLCGKINMIHFCVCLYVFKWWLPW